MRVKGGWREIEGERERVRVEENLKSTTIHNIYQVTDEFSRTRLQLDYMLTISGDFK